ncbi:unnamed protein product [Urochloa humidicola]
MFLSSSTTAATHPGDQGHPRRRPPCRPPFTPTRVPPSDPPRVPPSAPTRGRQGRRALLGYAPLESPAALHAPSAGHVEIQVPAGPNAVLRFRCALAPPSSSSLTPSISSSAGSQYLPITACLPDRCSPLGSWRPARESIPGCKSTTPMTYSTECCKGGEEQHLHLSAVMLLKEYQTVRRRSSNKKKHVSKDRTQQFQWIHKCWDRQRGGNLS